MSRPLVRRTLALASASALALAIAAASPITADAATTYQAGGGAAYGSTVKIGNLVSSGKTSYLTMCTTNTNYSQSSNTAGVNLGPTVGTIGALTTNVSTKKSGNTYSSVTTTKTGATSLLGGLITASAITASSTASTTNGTITDTGSSTLVDLKIAGISYSATPAPNTKAITIPGVAEILLNQQSVLPDNKELSVNALRVNILNGNPLGLPSGYIVVGNAKASIQTVSSLPYGSAYGTQVDLLGIVSSGATAQVNIPCGGNDGIKRFSNVAGLSVPGVINTGLARTSAVGTNGPTSTTATTKAIIDDINLLAGVVELDTITTKASATRTGNTVVSSSGGSSLVGLKINGKAITVTGKENQKIDVLGLGTVYLKKVTRTDVSIQVIGLQVTLNTKIGTLTKGTVINVGVTKAGVKKI